MELNRDEIIKALECCGIGCFNIATCEKCPFTPKEEAKGSLGCNDELIRAALALIKELTQAHDMLSESYDHLEKTKDELLAERSRLTEENERLRNDRGALCSHIVHTETEKRITIADTVRKYREALYRAFAHFDSNDKFNKKVFLEAVYQIAEELIEQTN